MKRIILLILVITMFLPCGIAAEPLERTDLYIQISDIGGHYDVNFDIEPNTEIGGVMAVETYGECAMYMLTYDQYIPYANQSIIAPAPSSYTYMLQMDYSQAPIQWNLTIPDTGSNWYFMFYKVGGSLSKMNVNASIWDWEYNQPVTTYPTNTTIIVTNTTTTITETSTTTTYTNTTTGTFTSYPTDYQPLIIDVWLVGMVFIVVFGIIAVYLVTRHEKTGWK